jgi:predicted metalloendopeptidase
MRSVTLALVAFMFADLASHSAGPWGIKLADRDPSVRAADDLYLSQNGAWLKRTTLGPTQPATSDAQRG